MTICAAAICNAGDIVLGISDWAQTSGDFKFESPRAKLFGFAPANVVALYAGETEICYAIAEMAHHRIIENNITRVRDVAYAFGSCFAAYRRELAEAKYLTPLGIDCALFNQQRRMPPAHSKILIEQMQNEKLDATAIIAGFDKDEPNQAHIYHVADPGTIIPVDAQGYCAIGSGWRYFAQEFMLSSYQPRWAVMDAALLMYTAKKKSEVTPNVGALTTMTILNTHSGCLVHQDCIATLEKYRKDMEAARVKKWNNVRQTMFKKSVTLRCVE